MLPDVGVTWRARRRCLRTDPGGPMAEIDPLELLFIEPGASDDPAPGYAKLREQCPVARVPGMMGEPNVWISTYDDALWALKHPEVFSSKEASTSATTTAHPAFGRSAGHTKYRRLLDPEFSPTKDGAARARGAQARERDHRRVRRQRRVRLPRRLRDAAAVDDLPRADGPAAGRPPRLPPLARRHDPPAGRRHRRRRTRSAQAAGKAINDYFERRSRRSATNPDDRLLSRIVTRRGRRPAARRTPSCSASATCCCSAGSTPSPRRSTA